MIIGFVALVLPAAFFFRKRYDVKREVIIEKEIIHIEDAKSLEMEIRFVKPIKATAWIITEVTASPENQTKLSPSNAGTLPVPVNLFILEMEKHVVRDMG